MSVILFCSPQLTLEIMWKDGKGQPAKICLYFHDASYLNKLVRAFSNVTEKDIEAQNSLLIRVYITNKC